MREIKEREEIGRSSKINLPLVGIVAALLVVGLTNLYSASSVWGVEGPSSIFYSQIVWILIGGLVCLLAWYLDYHLLERFAYPFYILTILGLVAVLVWGEDVSGHQSWLRIGRFNIQPSEFAKVGYLAALAKYFGRRDNLNLLDWRQMQVPFLMTLVPLLLVVLEGDLGSAIFFVLVLMTLTLIIGVRTKVLTILGTGSLVAVVMAYFLILSPYQRARIETFLDPGHDPHGQGYQLIQSKIAVGSGKIFGKGYMKGMQNKLLYLPEKHTDFIFPVLAEEWGFVGALAVVVLYLGLVTSGVRIAAKAKDQFGIFMALGITILLFWHVVINTGGVLGLLPLTGVTLPLLSYGGSSLVSVFFQIGVLLSISSRQHIF